jgi:phosphoglycolate phosphatase
MLPPCEALLFDFDGTLAVHNLDFADMRRRLVCLTLEQGLPQELLHELPMLELIDHAATWLDTRAAGRGWAYFQQAQQLLQDIEVEAAQRGGLLPGAHELLLMLQQHGIAVGIVTRNCDVAVRTMFPQLDTYCQVFLPRDHVSQVKPHPAHLQAALDQLGTTPARTLMVGDGSMDMQAGKNLAMFSIGVLSGTGSRESLLAHGADLILDSVADLLHYLPQPHHKGSQV